ncbi:MAG: carbamate kinase [Deltaproteobacteria bacterium]|nr:carbamate kinase [Deltaproteobacteria bacterium]
MTNSHAKKEVLLIALGGNALIQRGQEGTAAQQMENLKVPARQIARLSRDYRIIVTHGNGPQVGNILLQQESCDEVPKLPLEILVAQTQGQIGYMIESTLDTALMEIGIDTEQLLVNVITYVVVDQNDPAFDNPSKPIGPVYSEEKAAALPYPTRKTAKGYRRVVASPRPVTVIEKREIRKLVDMDFIVICCGGGGIPVVRQGRAFAGVDAVIDKDLCSAKLAEEVGVDSLIIATDVEGAAINYGKPNQKILRSLTLEDMARFWEEGHFPPGSMGPKVEAAMDFLDKGGKRAVITSIENIEKAVRGEAGTEIVKAPSGQA